MPQSSQEAPGRHESTDTSPANMRRTRAADVDRAFAPEEIERLVRNVELTHVSNARIDPIPYPERRHVAIQLLDIRTMVIDRNDPRRGVLCEYTRRVPVPQPMSRTRV